MNRKFLDESVYKLEHWQNEKTNRSGYLKGLALDCWQHPEADRQSHYFARELVWTGRPKSAIKEFERHLTISWWNAERSQSMIYIAECYLMLGQEAKAIEWFHKAYQEDGGRREALIKLAELYFRKSDWLKVSSYCKAALEIPWSGYYATTKPYYENVPHELLAEAKWHLGDRESSKFHFDRAIEYQPLSGKLLHDYRFHYGLPKISILIPTLKRPDGLKRCLDSIDRLNYPREQLEVLYEEDEPRLGVPKRLDNLYKQSTGEYIVFASDDVEFTPDSLMLAYLDMTKAQKGLCAFNTDKNILPDEGNICEHFMIKRDLVEKIGGKIFDTDFDHCGCDNLLWYKCKKINEAMRSERAVVVHHHYTKENVVMDEVYAIGNAKRAEDRKLLQRKINEIELQDFILHLKTNTNFNFTKVGDGEMMCIRGDAGANIDGQSYGKELGNELVVAYRDLASRDNATLAIQSNPQWRLMDVEQWLFAGLAPRFNHWTYDLLLHREGELTPMHLAFYKTIKESSRKKIFVGNKSLLPVKDMLNIQEFIEVPSRDAFNSINKTLSKLEAAIEDNCIVLLSAGLISKVLMHKALDKNSNITCIDTGSAFDPIFIGQTRTEQISTDKLKEFYKELINK